MWEKIRLQVFNFISWENCRWHCIVEVQLGGGVSVKIQIRIQEQMQLLSFNSTNIYKAAIMCQALFPNRYRLVGEFEKKIPFLRKIDTVLIHWLNFDLQWTDFYPKVIPCSSQISTYTAPKNIFCVLETSLATIWRRFHLPSFTVHRVLFHLWKEREKQHYKGTLN